MSQIATTRQPTAQRSTPPSAGSAPAGAMAAGAGPAAVRAAPGNRGNLSVALEGTPGRLRIAAFGAVFACLAFALLGASAFQARGNALDEARADAAQLVRVQQIATSVVEADSLFTNGYLTYGLDTADQLNGYADALATASRSIAQAARANPADATDLAVVNQALVQYTARVAASRANNLLGNQVATGYLRQAANLLRDPKTSPNMLPTLDKLITANTTRVDDAYGASRWATVRLALAAVVVLAGLGVVQVWLARRTHRYLNVPLAGASAAVLLVLIVGALVMVTAQSKADQVRDGAYTSTLALAKARIAAFTGKSAESISLTYLGTGGPYAASEAIYQASRSGAEAQLQTVNKVSGIDPGTKELLDWNTVHQKVYKLAQSDWIAAVKAATGTGQGSVNATFKALSDTTEGALTIEATQVDNDLGRYHGALVALGWLTLVVGLIAAGAAWSGVSQRLEEYR